MSFLSVLGTIGKDVVKGLGVADPFIQFAAPFVPGGSILATILHSIIAAEQLVSKDNSGPQKKAIATQIVNTVHPNLDPQVVSSAIDSLVAVFNALDAAVIKASVASSSTVVAKKP